MNCNTPVLFSSPILGLPEMHMRENGTIRLDALLWEIFMLLT